MSDKHNPMPHGDDFTMRDQLDRSLLDKSPVLFFIINHQNVVIETRGGSCDNFLHISSCLGKKVSDVFHSSDLEKWNSLREDAESGEPANAILKIMTGDKSEVFADVEVWCADYDKTPCLIAKLTDFTMRSVIHERFERYKTGFTALIETFPLPFQSFDENGKTLLVNHEWLRILGYEKQDVIGQPLSSFVIDSDRDSLHAPLQSFLDGKGDCHFDLKLKCRNGSELLAEFVCRTGVDVDTGRIRHHCIFHNISQKRMTERRVRDSEERYRLIAENARDMITKHDLDGNYLYASPFSYTLIGYEPSELLGRNTYDIIFSEDHENVAANHRNLLSGSQNESVECRLIHKDGSHVWVETMSSIIRSDNGGAGTILAITRDVREKRKIHDFIQSREKQYRSLFESSLQAIVVLDPTSRILDVNPAALDMFGYSSKDEILGRSVICGFQEQEQYNILLDQLMATGNLKNFEASLKKMDDSNIQVEVMGSATAQFDENGEMEQIQVYLTDVTERKLLQSRLLDAMKMESLVVLAGGIAHDFNNLLASMLGYTDLAMAADPNSTSLKKYLNRIREGTIESAKLCSQLLAYSGQGRYFVKPLNMSEAIREMGKLLETSIPKGATLQINLAENIPLIEADTLQIQQVVINLVTNSGEALADKNGLIKLTTGTRKVSDMQPGSFVSDTIANGNYVFLEVSDNGSGMDAKTLTRVFDPFFSTKFIGRGLGMSSTLGIVRSHKGYISLVSTPGAGTTATVLFPISSAATGNHEKHSANNNSKATRILIADDLGYVREILKDILASLGYDPLVAKNGTEAVELFTEHEHNLLAVILDATMPVMGGIEAMKLIRKANRTIPIVISSGYGEREIMEEGPNGEVSGFIHKPYSIAALKSLLTELLGDTQA